MKSGTALQSFPKRGPPQRQTLSQADQSNEGRTAASEQGPTADHPPPGAGCVGPANVKSIPKISREPAMSGEGAHKWADSTGRIHGLGHAIEEAGI